MAALPAPVPPPPPLLLCLLLKLAPQARCSPPCSIRDHTLPVRISSRPAGSKARSRAFPRLLPCPAVRPGWRPAPSACSHRIRAEMQPVAPLRRSPGQQRQQGAAAAAWPASAVLVAGKQGLRCVVTEGRLSKGVEMDTAQKQDRVWWFLSARAGTSWQRVLPSFEILIRSYRSGPMLARAGTSSQLQALAVSLLNPQPTRVHRLVEPATSLLPQQQRAQRSAGEHRGVANWPTDRAPSTFAAARHRPPGDHRRRWSRCRCRSAPPPAGPCLPMPPIIACATGGLRLRPGRPADGALIRREVFREVLNPLGLDPSRFTVAERQAEDGSARVLGFGQIKPLSGSGRGSGGGPAALELASLVVLEQERCAWLALSHTPGLCTGAPCVWDMCWQLEAVTVTSRATKPLHTHSHPPCRGQGVGTQLVRSLVAQAGQTPLFLTTISRRAPLYQRCVAPAGVVAGCTPAAGRVRSCKPSLQIQRAPHRLARAT